MKRIVTLILALVMVLGAVGCGGNKKEDNRKKEIDSALQGAWTDTSTSTVSGVTAVAAKAHAFQNGEWSCTVTVMIGSVYSDTVRVGKGTYEIRENVIYCEGKDDDGKVVTTEIEYSFSNGVLTLKSDGQDWGPFTKQK